MPIRLPSLASDRVEAIVDVLATGVARLAKWVLYAFLGMMALGMELSMILNIAIDPNPFPCQRRIVGSGGRRRIGKPLPLEHGLRRVGFWGRSARRHSNHDSNELRPHS